MHLQLPDRVLPLDLPVVMGILNVTPDSFSDGGRYVDVDAAVARGLAMVAQGAQIIDVGGESTRPGAEVVSADDEAARVVPVIRALRAVSDVVISIDTMKPEVMRAACAAGAELINDVLALRAPGALDAARETRAAVCLMHMQNEPRTMQAAPDYADVNAEVRNFLAERLAVAEAAGIVRERLCVDPGIGFGKTLAHNLLLLADLTALAELEVPVLIGVSRKSMFGRLLDRDIDERLPGALSATAVAVWQGAAIVRSHDVPATLDAIRVATALRRARARLDAGNIQ